MFTFWVDSWPCELTDTRYCKIENILQYFLLKWKCLVENFSWKNKTKQMAQIFKNRWRKSVKTELLLASLAYI